MSDSDHIPSILSKLLSSYANVVLYFPRLFVRLNLRWNPIFIFGRRFFARMLKDAGYEIQRADQRRIEEQPKPAIERVRRWLEPNEYGGEHIALASYPRSGNTLLRHLLEEVTGVYTGCDTRPDRSLSRQLHDAGMHGEGIVDDSVWVVKTHYPERHGWKPFKAKKAILVVRNPWDAMDSYFNMMLTNSHRTSIAESQYERFADRWNDFVHSEIKVWMKFHSYWTRKQPIPVMVVRYEDLLIHREETLRRVFMFLTDKDSLEGTDLMERIKRVSGLSDGPYKPRSGRIAASFRHYSTEQFRIVLETARNLLTGFGYDTEKQNFPDTIPLPTRQKIPAAELSDGAQEKLVHVNGDNKQIRRPDDQFGRTSTQFRHSLLDPVISRDGSPLNMHEVLIARELHANKKKKQEQNQ